MAAYSRQLEIQTLPASYAVAWSLERERHWPGVAPVFILKNRQK
jgi:hypothetical protein